MHIRERLRSEEGFTLVELMVVVLIIAILIAIAIPTFLGARTRAQDRAVQSDLRNALTAAKVHYADANSDYGFVVADLDAVHASLDFVAGVPLIDQVGFTVFANEDGTPDQAVMFLALSQSGTWFCLWDEASGSMSRTYFGQSAAAATFVSRADCTNGW
ncbi:MAG: prepilin-type N-terminal cleavage/methylation domain-containing protein [Acidimicrobiia bacterium]|nr:prepilin-type N-terminal cleavage/methylation domain-containing protein [Acidimicrobiia bacterium]